MAVEGRLGSWNCVHGMRITRAVCMHRGCWGRLGSDLHNLRERRVGTHRSDEQVEYPRSVDGAADHTVPLALGLR